MKSLLILLVYSKITNSFNVKDVLVKSANFIVEKEFSSRNEFVKSKNFIREKIFFKIFCFKLKIVNIRRLNIRE